MTNPLKVERLVRATQTLFVAGKRPCCDRFDQNAHPTGLHFGHAYQKRDDIG
jgi:hypothetical protein